MTLQRAYELVTANLEPGEERLWVGVPRRGLSLRAQDAFLGALFGVILVSAGARMGQSQAQALVFVIVAVQFVCFILGRPVLEVLTRARTAYGLTDRRVLFVREGRGESLTSRPLDALADISLRTWRDGVGTISLGPVPADFSAGGPRGAGAPCFGAALEGIEGAARVHRQILAAREALRTGRGASR